MTTPSYYDKPSYNYPWWESQSKESERLESLKGSDVLVPFSTRKMADRGKVFHCKIDSEGNAIVVKAEEWWAMSFYTS